MSTSRRQFIKHFAGAAVATAAGTTLGHAASSANYTLSGETPRAKHYGYLGRTEDYREWAVVPRGVTVKS